MHSLSAAISYTNVKRTVFKIYCIYSHFLSLSNNPSEDLKNIQICLNCSPQVFFRNWVGLLPFCEHIFRLLPSHYFILAQLYKFNISGIPNLQPIPGKLEVTPHLNNIHQLYLTTHISSTVLTKCVEPQPISFSHTLTQI